MVFVCPGFNILRHMEDLAPFDVLDAVAASLSTPARLELGEWLTSRVAPKLIELDQTRQQALDHWSPTGCLPEPKPDVVHPGLCLLNPIARSHDVAIACPLAELPNVNGNACWSVAPR